MKALEGDSDTSEGSSDPIIPVHINAPDPLIAKLKQLWKRKENFFWVLGSFDISQCCFSQIPVV